MNFKTISVIGLGYIGLPTAAAFAASKVKVIGVDVNQGVVDTINAGKIHIVEPSLGGIVKSTVESGYLRATCSPESADAFLIAVPTPFEGDHVPDLSYIEAASRSIAPVLKQGDLVILESTSPVGTTEKMAGWLSEMRKDLTFPKTHGENSDVRIAYCPERVLPGQVMKELIEHDRVIGGLTSKCSKLSVKLYKTFVKGECVITNTRTAEMAKLTENSFRDVNIAFANELSMICDKLDIDTQELIRISNRHPRVSILQPGAGVGGHCIAVDPWFIVSQSPKEAKIIKAAREVNIYKTIWVKEKVQAYTNEFLKERGREPLVACLGLSFKPNIDDLRESPALVITRLLMNEGIRIIAVEPNIPESTQLEGKIKIASLESALDKADIFVILVAHDEFKGLVFPESATIDICGIS